jgi:deazaflavin-dependent oxidoreductase (nitroreductase family)
MIDWKTLNPQVIEEFRSNGGRVAQFGDLPVVILHTIGARSGRVREIPLVVIREGEEMLLFGTAAGASAHPAWYFNLRAQPRIEVELGSERFTAELVELPEAEASKKVETQAASIPQFAAYMESAAPRAIPVFSILRA